MNNITIEFCAEDRARLDILIVLMTRLVNNQGELPEVSPDKAMIGVELEKLQPVEEVKEDADAAMKHTPAPSVTEADIRKLARSLIESGKKAQLKEIVNKYAPSITDIPSESYASVYDELKALAEA